jgi:hypothetical protein
MTTLFTHPQHFSWLTLFFLSSLSFVIRCIVAPTDPEDKIVSELSFETSMVGAKITEEQLSAQDLYKLISKICIFEVKARPPL